MELRKEWRRRRNREEGGREKKVTWRRTTHV